jgi:hypothetical protein
MAEYIEVSKTDFQDILNKQKYDWQEFSQPKTMEALFKVKTPNDKITIVIYSSIDILTQKSRGVGEDAIRIILWNERDNRPLGKGKRVYRVTSKESIAIRINKTITAFLSEALKTNLIDWDYVKAILRETVKSSTKKDFPLSLLESLKSVGRLSQGQLAYVVGEETPKGYPTMEGRLKTQGWVYNPDFDDTPIEEEMPVEEIEESNLDEYTDDTEKHLKSTCTDNYVSSIPIISNAENIELIPTAGYTYKFPFFNPVQSLVHPYRNEDTNMIIGANTSSGKTICAELLMEECLKRDKW